MMKIRDFFNNFFNNFITKNKSKFNRKMTESDIVKRIDNYFKKEASILENELKRKFNDGVILKNEKEAKKEIQKYIKKLINIVSDAYGAVYNDIDFWEDDLRQYATKYYKQLSESLYSMLEFSIVNSPEDFFKQYGGK